MTATMIELNPPHERGISRLTRQWRPHIDALLFARRECALTETGLEDYLARFIDQQIAGGNLGKMGRWDRRFMKFAEDVCDLAFFGRVIPHLQDWPKVADEIEAGGRHYPATICCEYPWPKPPHARRQAAKQQPPPPAA